MTLKLIPTGSAVYELNMINNQFHSIRFTVLAVFILAGIISCEDPATQADGTPIAQVGDKVLTKEEVEAKIGEGSIEDMGDSALQNYRSNWIRQQVLAQEARRLGLHQDEKVRQRIEQLKDDLLSSILTDAVIEEFEQQHEVSRQEAQSYYEENREDFLLNEPHIRFRHLIAANRRDVDNASRALHRGEDWESIARRYDVNPERAISQARQYFPLSDAAASYPPINRFLHNIGVTEISPVRRIGSNYHLVQLREERPEGDHPEPEWILDQIQEWLTIQERRNHLATFEQNLVIQAESNNEIRLFDVDGSEPVDEEFEPDTLISN